MPSEITPAAKVARCLNRMVLSPLSRRSWQQAQVFRPPLKPNEGSGFMLLDPRPSLFLHDDTLLRGQHHLVFDHAAEPRRPRHGGAELPRIGRASHLNLLRPD